MMLDNVLIVITLMFLVIQVIVSCQLSFVVARSKKEGGMVVSNFWCNSMPCLLLVFTTIMLVCAIKTEDTMILMLPILLSMCFLFDMHIFYFDGEKMNHYYFLLQKNVCKSLSVKENSVIAEFGEKKKIIRMSSKKLEKVTLCLKQ
ncbi:MAG: hypothetical protein ACI4QX_02770 [Lachnospiraceae bacterium]